MNWYEDLPDNCPEVDAFLPNGEIFYRFCESFPAKSSDFFSHHKSFPGKDFGGESLCILKSVSLWNNIGKCRRVGKLPTLKSKVLSKITLSSNDGKVKKTRGPFHYSWWRTDEFNHTFAERVEL